MVRREEEVAEKVQKKDEVFTISQIGEEGTVVRGTVVRDRANEIANFIVEPVAEEFELGVDRSDRDPTPGPITSKLLRSILSSRIVVADLTGNNPNVFYELSFAHSFGLAVVILTDKTENLPFDLKNERVIPLGDEGSIGLQQGEEAKRKLREAFGVVLQEGYKPNSLVTEVAGVQNIESMTPDNPIASELAALKQSVDQIYTSMGATPRRNDNAYKQADVLVLMDLLESFVRDNKATTEQVEALITDTTSVRFDSWVEQIKDRYSDEIKEADFDDIPF